MRGEYSPYSSAGSSTAGSDAGIHPRGGASPALRPPLIGTSNSSAPDQKRVACFDNSDRTAPVEHIVRMADGSIVQSLSLPSTVASLQWSPGGDGLVYVEDQPEGANLWFQPVDGGRRRQLTHFRSDSLIGYAWAPDKKSLICSRGSYITDVYLIRLDTGGPASNGSNMTYGR